MKIRPANPERIVDVLIRPCPVSVERDGEARNANSCHLAPPLSLDIHAKASTRNPLIRGEAILVDRPVTRTLPARSFPSLKCWQVNRPLSRTISRQRPGISPRHRSLLIRGQDVPRVAAGCRGMETEKDGAIPSSRQSARQAGDGVAAGTNQLEGAVGTGGQWPREETIPQSPS